MKDYKENFANVVDYAVNKTKLNWWKLILLGIMGSVYVAIAYVAFIYILGSFEGVVNEIKLNDNGAMVFKIELHGGALVTAAAVFPVGIILIVFLGGSLFTSDNLTSIAVITKKITILPVIMKWIYTLLGNFIGAFIAAIIMRAGNIFKNEDYQLILGYLSGKKIDLEWYYTIFSAVLCNVIVAGSVWSTLATKHSSAKIFLLYFPIWLFAIVGFQHVVANVILFAMTLLYSINPEEQSNILAGMNYAVNEGIHQFGYGIWKSDLQSLVSDGVLDGAIRNNIEKNWMTVGSFTWISFLANLVPAAIGNWFSGAIILPFTYYFLSSYRKSKISSKNENNGTE